MLNIFPPNELMKIYQKKRGTIYLKSFHALRLPICYFIKQQIYGRKKG